MDAPARSMANLAAAIYGNPPSDGAGGRPVMDAPGASIVGGPPDPTPNARLAEAMYPDHLANVIAPQLNENMPRLRDYLNLTAEQETQLRATHVGFFKGVVNEGDAGRVHDLLTAHTIQPPTDEEVETWRVEANRTVRETYREDADHWMREAKALIATQPGFRQELQRTGLGSHPAVVLSVIKAARRKAGYRE